MMHKLTQNIAHIAIGRKTTFVLILLMMLVLNSCKLFNWDKEDDFYYTQCIKNTTKDTLLLVLGKDNEEYNLDEFKLMPDSILYTGLNFGVNKGDDPIFNNFNDGYRPLEEQARIYRNDSLLITWEGPAEYKDSLHHFYNYNSWEYWIEDGDEGIVMFTIYESDLEN
jgi:hypothetical protein